MLGLMKLGLHTPWPFNKVQFCIGCQISPKISQSTAGFKNRSLHRQFTYQNICADGSRQYIFFFARWDFVLNIVHYISNRIDDLFYKAFNISVLNRFLWNKVILSVVSVLAIWQREPRLCSVVFFKLSGAWLSGYWLPTQLLQKVSAHSTSLARQTECVSVLSHYSLVPSFCPLPPHCPAKAGPQQPLKLATGSQAQTLSVHPRPISPSGRQTEFIASSSGTQCLAFQSLGSGNQGFTGA